MSDETDLIAGETPAATVFAIVRGAADPPLRRTTILDRNGHAQKCCRDRRAAFIATFVLGIEQALQFLLQIRGAPAFFRGFKRVHGRAVVFFELVDKHWRRSGVIENKCVALE